MKKLLNCKLVLAMLLCISLAGCDVESKATDDILANYNIIFYETDTNIENDGGRPNIVVLTEEQLLQLGDQAKELLENNYMLYVLTDMSSNEIKKVCDMTSTVSSSDTHEYKFATAIIKDGDENYALCDVSALFADTAASNETNSLSDITEEQMIYDGLYSILNTMENGFN